jgi:hypothetical protein
MITTMMAPLFLLQIFYIVKPVIRGHLWDKEKVGKGKRADVYLEVRKRREHILF